MGHIWLIYGLYMGYLTECSMVKPLQGVYKYWIVYIPGKQEFLK
ncbi:hypothetical protein SAMN04488121_11079 [Chitinophaga filiformis]|uniref:Uncharacterized protein n=1 Tax=Chitinophaga filiformis TaxID=104663 RepID=A0A1G8B1M9_CHIFI|nr:hypothetical protein SAMN04488121_11079 [Chitinophaga filiformis]